MNFLAFSGGKDSTAMALRLAEMGEDFTLLFTPTGNELPGLREHIARIRAMTGKPLVEPRAPTLAQVIESEHMLPNHRARFCTRMIKIVPCRAYLLQHPGSTLLVGLRADEEEREGGIYGDAIAYRTPLREWGWGLADVRRYVHQRGVMIPARTDCAVCFFQRLDEWWTLWAKHPDLFAQGERWEAESGHTFRSPGRDSWPVPLALLRAAFEGGKEPRAITRARQITCLLDEDEEGQKCRVCSL